ncbi:TPA: cell division protein FtsA [Candidatus Nomurabacteria bacterium]|nr:MAG: Cell division protein ftsA [Parcubacteria bacterium RAAC4_OD1_1]HCY26481.1 cell division protein FtsA [Candidatus Nomurabacteria bacterium]
MNKKNYTCGIDIGSSFTKVVVLGYEKGGKDLTLLASSYVETRGVRLGYITNVDHVAGTVKKAISSVENVLGFKIKNAYISIEGINLSSVVSIGSSIISKADQEITELDVHKAIDNSEENLDTPNKKIIHTIPLSYKIDGKDIFGHPESMKGIKLEVRTLFITCLKQNVEDIITVFGLLNINILDIIASPIASSNILLSTKQKTAGCALLDIGCETVSLTVFEENSPIYLITFPFGSMDITKDIALGFKISLEEADSIKHGNVIGADYSKKKIDEIIEARLVDIFELVNNHLKKLKRNELLPAGIIITGGGALINKIEEIAKRELKLPASVGTVDQQTNNKLKIKDSSWYTAYGLALSSKENFDNQNIYNSLGVDVKQVKGFFKSIFSQLLP